jgi:hypothetical protein
VTTRVGYIGGLGRSGSTLLERIAARLDGVCVLGEVVHLWNRGIEYDELCSCGEPFSRCPFWVEVGTAAFGGWEKVDLPRVHALAARVDRTRYIPAAGRARGRGATEDSSDAGSRRRDMAEYAGYFAAVYAAAAQVSGAQVVLDSSKHPSTAYLLRLLDELDLRVVHLVRDSRGVAYSWTKVLARPEATERSEQAEMYRYPPWRAALLWDTHNLAFAALGRLGVPVWRLHYERLISEPLPTVTDLARFLGVDGTSVAQFVTADSVQVGPAHQISGNAMRFETGELRLRRDDAWRTALPAGPRRTVDLLTAPLLGMYGYLGPDSRVTRRIRPPEVAR